MGPLRGASAVGHAGMITPIPLGEWLPDAATVDKTVLTRARNVFPRIGGYGPVKNYSAYSATLGGQCYGAFAARTVTGGYAIFAATRTRLYKMGAAGASWTDVSSVHTFDIPESELLSMAQFGANLIVTNGNSPAPLYIDVDSGTGLSTLGGSPPSAKGVAVIGDFLVLYGLTGNPKRIQWSGLNDIAQWTPGSNYSDFQDFPDGGDVTGVVGGEYGVVLQTNACRRMVFLPDDATNAFRFVKIADTVGGAGIWSATRGGDTVFVLGSSGFYAFGGAGGLPVGGGSLGEGGLAPIGSGRVNEWFFANVDTSRLTRTLAVADVRASRVFWFFKSIDGGQAGLFDRAIVYDWKLDKWTYIDVTVEYALPAATSPSSLDDESGSLDDETGSLDDPALNASEYQFGAFNADHSLGFFTGDNLEAVIDTSDGFVGRPGLSMVGGIRPDVDAEDYRVSMASRMKLSDPLTFTAEAAPSVDGVCHVRRSARYHRARVRIPAGTEWQYLNSLGVQSNASGMR